MKTFEERYTAWIDGELEGAALVAFEQELVRRATVEEAHADKADALHMSAFLQDHLQAPALTNTDFFNHQLRERIAGERAVTERRPASAREEAAAPWFGWSFWRLGAAGAACLFIGGALYYGTIPQNGPGRAATVARATPAVTPATSATSGNGPQMVAGNDPAAPNPANGSHGVQFANISPEQQARLRREQELSAAQQKREIEPSADIQAKVPDQTAPTTATSLHYKKPDVNVLWVNGLDYLPDSSSLDGGSQGAAQTPAVGVPPAATATP